MARSAILSNGRLAVGLDERGFVSDLYYPHVGLENMLGARFVHHKIGVSVDGEFSWLDSELWTCEAGLDENTMMSRVRFHSEKYGIDLSFRDFVDCTYDFFGRVLIVNNHTDTVRHIKVFFSQVFQISDSGRADTALYTPAAHPYVLAYHGNISFITSLRTEDGQAFDQFAVGNYGIEGKSGTYLDAEDGVLSGNLVEHGGVDSVISTSFDVKPKHAYHVDYWIVASDESYHQGSSVHRTLSQSGLFHYLNATSSYWKAWLARATGFLNETDTRYLSLAKKSLLTIKAHCDKYGGVIASLDSSIYNYGRDYYSYVWPRDAYYALMPLLRIGYTEEVKSFLDFVVLVMNKHGYVYHKYQPDYSPGSTWHPLMQSGVPEPNIQVDETASVVLLALAYINKTSDEKYAKKLWDRIVRPACNFMSSNIDEETGLPHASYDLWEQVFLTTTYTTSVIYRALLSASEIESMSFVDTNEQLRWQDAAAGIRKNTGKLFSKKTQQYVRGLKSRTENFAQLDVLDISSLYGVMRYGLADLNDFSVIATLEAVEARLVIKSGIGGVIRYPDDNYMSASGTIANPWYVCTLWLGQCQDLIGNRKRLTDSLDWTLSRATASGMLSEQVDPITGEIRGVAPLVWSHAEFLSTLQVYNKSKTDI